MPAIYEDFRKILVSLVLDHPDFNDAEATLFGDAPPGAPDEAFSVLRPRR